MTQDHDGNHATVLRHSATLCAWSAELIARSQESCSAAQQAQRRTTQMTPLIAPLAVTELFTILVDHHELNVLEAVRRLAAHLAAAGYPEEADFVSASDAVDITHSILASQ